MSINLLAIRRNDMTRVKAKEICEKVIKQKDSSEGKINCINLLKADQSKRIKF